MNRFIPLGVTWGQLYALARHYKGGIYEVRERVFREGSGEPMIVYRCTSTGKFFVRPEREFCGEVDPYIPRYTLIPLKLPVSPGEGEKE